MDIPGFPGEEMKSLYPARELQITQLVTFFATKNEPFPPSLYIFGSTGTGKTSIVRLLMKKLKIKHALVNLTECYSSKLLFETILSELANHKVNQNVQAPSKCDNFMEFVIIMQKICAQEKCVIIVDKAEELRNMESNLLSGFLMLNQLIGEHVSVIFLSEIAFEKYYYKLNIVEPIIIYFPQYSKDEFLKILLLDYEKMRHLLVKTFHCDASLDYDFYSNYLNLFLSVFYNVCRDLRELQHMSKKNFLLYYEPIAKKQLTASNSMALWKHISPIFSSSLEHLYLRVSTSKSDTKSPSFQKVTQSFELPFYAKYLLIAAYLASYNSPKDDKRLFMKYHGKKRKTLKQVQHKSKVSEELNIQIGPKPFSLDRLLAIFYSILEDKVGFNNHLLVQVSSLVELQLLVLVSDDFNLDSRKYKCIVNFQVIQNVSRMVGFNIKKYLSDFSHN